MKPCNELLPGYPIRDFLEQLNCQPETRRTYRRSLNRLCDFLKERDDGPLDADALRAWQQALHEQGYQPRTINIRISAVNNYLRWCGRFDLMMPHDPLPEPESPTLTRNEYLRLLRAARAQGKHRLYLVIKLFAVTGVPVQSIGQVTAELVRAGGGTVRYRGKQEMVHIPPVLQREILDYLQEQGIVFGPIFLSVRGEPMGRVQMFRELQELCADAHVPVQKGNPRALRNLYRETIDSIAKNMDVLIQGAYEQFLQVEQTTAGWNTAE